MDGAVIAPIMTQNDPEEKGSCCGLLPPLEGARYPGVERGEKEVSCGSVHEHLLAEV